MTEWPKALVERVSDAIEDAMASDDNGPNDLARAALDASGLQEAIEVLDYVYERTYCARDGEWHFKPPYDPQRVIDILARIKGETNA